MMVVVTDMRRMQMQMQNKTEIIFFVVRNTKSQEKSDV